MVSLPNRAITIMPLTGQTSIAAAVRYHPRPQSDLAIDNQPPGGRRPTAVRWANAPRRRGVFGLYADEADLVAVTVINERAPRLRDGRYVLSGRDIDGCGRLVVAADPGHVFSVTYGVSTLLAFDQHSWPGALLLVVRVRWQW